MQQNQYLLYGANGYTGELIARFSAKFNLQPILAGRRKEALIPLSKTLGYPYKVIDLNNAKALQAVLKEVKVVVNAAGPYDFTAKQMVEACLKTGTHYIDLNGDMTVYELIQAYDEAATKAGIMLLPGAGFDVVPTDCIALFLKKLLPDATSLKLAFATPGGGISKGTAMTTVLKLGEPGAKRKDGKIVPVPVGEKSMRIKFSTGTAEGKKELFVMSLPWGDVYTAWFTTGIPDIEAYTNAPIAAFYFLKFQFLFNWLLRTAFVRNIVKNAMLKKPAGLNDEQRDKATSLVWGQVKNQQGKTATATLSGPDAYTMTADSTLLITQKILAGNFKAGYQTPAGAYGEDLVLEIDGVTRETVR